MTKRRLNIYLSPDLLRRLKHAAVDAGKSVSQFIEDRLVEKLTKRKTPRDPSGR